MSSTRMLAVAFLALFALCAIAASSAQAFWLVNGTILTGTESVNVAKTTTIVKSFIFRFDEIEVECGKLEVSGAKITAPDKGSATSLEFSGCKVVRPDTCTLRGTTVGTLPVEALAILDGALATKAKVKPVNVNELFTTFQLSGASCSFSGKNVVVGEVGVLSAEGQDVRPAHAVEIKIETGGEFKFGGAELRASGAAEFKLEGGQAWSFI